MEYLVHAGRKWNGYKHYNVTSRDDFDFTRFPTQALLMNSVWSTELIIERIEVCFDQSANPNLTDNFDISIYQI